MNQHTYSYSLYEGTFLSPPPIFDRSIQLLMFRDPDDHEYQLIINRTMLDEDQEIEAWCEAEMDKLRHKLPGFKTEGKLLKHEIGPAKLQVVQIANRYLSEGEIKRQIQSIIKLPQHSRYNPLGRDILIFTLNSVDEFTEYQRKHYVQVINSFSPDID
ncbi:DcrB-related protein [Serratia sp. NA_112.1]|uniref:DcrB-related protein n=1 Tax=Serratia sp. NA_112.1 TaxID=3415665 RepID=UPI004046A302